MRTLFSVFLGLGIALAFTHPLAGASIAALALMGRMGADV